MSAAQPDPVAESKSRLLKLVSENLRNGSIELPSLPDIAIDIRVAISKPDVEISDLVKLIQQDPGLTAYLIKVALSAFYSRGNPAPNLTVAINRLGLNAARDLTMGYALKTLFMIKDAGIKRRMHECWRRSVHTAALANVMARHCGFNPDRALLAGLLQDIGALPLLVNLKNFPDIYNSHAATEMLIREFTGKISGLVLHSWNFDNDLITTALHLENWMREHDHAKDLTDLILVARYHTYLHDRSHSTLPKLCSLPAFQKLGLDDIDPAQGVSFLKEAEQEIAELRSLLQD